MALTEFAVNDPLAVKLWSSALAQEAEKIQYFRKFMGTDANSLIVVKKELTKSAGDKVTFGLQMKLAGDGVEGDNPIEGSTAEEKLRFFDDYVMIDQRRKGTKSKGKMSEQRVPYNIRKKGRQALSVWFAEDSDEQCFMYLSGARGIDTSFHVPLSWTTRAGNALSAPDSDHIIYADDATGVGDIVIGDVMALPIVDRLVAKAETLDPMIQPFRVNGEKKYVLLMHTFQAHALRTSTTENDWMDIQKLAGVRGKGNLVYQNALGEYADVILHKHRNVIRFDNYGTGANLAAARALFLGAQAGMCAYGKGGGTGRYSWNEETDDRGNQLAITAGSIHGHSKTTFNSKDFGVVAVDTCYVDPT